jgi:hypothetical protein
LRGSTRCTWILARCRVVAHTEKLVRDIQNKLTVAIERRFGELMGRLDTILPDSRSRAEKTFKFSSERDDGINDLPDPGDIAQDASKLKMPVYFVTEGDRGIAYWRANDEAPDVFVCAVAMDAYNSEPQIRDRFAELVNAVAAYERRAFVAGTDKPAASRLAGFPCETCTTPEADEIRHFAGQVSDAGEIKLSPGGLPLGCCKVVAVAAFGSRPGT